MLKRAKAFLYRLQANARRHLPVTAVSLLSRGFIGKYPVAIPDNRLYGAEFTLKNFIGLPQGQLLRTVIEHGIVFDDYWFCHYEKYGKTPMCVVSSYRKELIEKFGRGQEVHSIGPHIHYARPLHSPEKLALQKSAGGGRFWSFPRTVHQSPPSVMIWRNSWR